MAAINIPIVTTYQPDGTNKALAGLKNLTNAFGGYSAIAEKAVSFLKDATLAYAKDQKTQDLLATTLTNVTHATKQQIAADEQFITAMQNKYAVADQELRPALGNLVRATGSVTTSQQLLTTALNISAGTGRDLGTVTMALGRAYNGNFGGLQRMGVAIDASIVKNKDFAGAVRILDTRFQGLAQTFADSPEGKIQAMNIAWTNFKEAVGQIAWPVVEKGLTDITGLVTNVTNALNGNHVSWKNIVSDVLHFNGLLGPLNKEFEWAAKAWDKVTGANEKLKKSIQSNDDITGHFRIFEQTTTANYDQAQAAKKLADAHAKVKDAATSTADTMRNRLSAAAQTAKDRLDALKSSADSLKSSIQSSLDGMVSLSSAVSDANQTDRDYQDALKKRADAYAALQQAQSGFIRDDANGQLRVATAWDLAKATQAVADAEQNVNTAAAAKKDYAAEFANQVNAAKNFGADLKTLVGMGLGDAGLQQLLSAGPVAGDQIAQAILAGTSGLSVGSINSSLADLSSVGAQLGSADANQVYGSDIAAAQNQYNQLQTAVNNNVTINVASADPNAVVAALQKYMRQNGSIPIKVKT